MSGTGPSKPASDARDAIASAIVEEETRIRRLEAEHAGAKERLARLRDDLASLAEPDVVRAVPSPSMATAPRSPAEKVTLFRQLFRGRSDLYPTRFVSKKTGKAGYAPACSNKWEPGLCALKTGGKCSDCANQAFRPVDDAAVLGHLRGQHVMGVYPMLPDETCWFLAVDFDKSTWQEDVRAFVATARGIGLPALIERSRSGNGAHVWFFFSEPVSAATARKVGCHLITETMASRHELSMESYDRLFPSQDTMPSGGFGNLIALPLQHGPRQQGNSVFLEESLKPYPDDQQWSVLAAVQRVDAAAIDRVAIDATRSGTIVGVRSAESADAEEEVTAPWMRPPSGSPRVRRIPGPMPARVSAVLSQRLFIAKHGVPSPLLNQVKRLAAFQNPEFYKKQSMRLSTALTPRVISCAEDLSKHVALPRGCRSDLEELLRVHGVPRLVVRECGVQILDPNLLVVTRSPEARIAHDQSMLERPRRRLGLRVDFEAHGADLHLGNRVIAVAALRRRCEPHDIPCLHLAEDALELHRGEVMALVDDNLPVARDEVRDRVFPHEALDHCDVQPAGWSALRSCDHPDRLPLDP